MNNPDQSSKYRERTAAPRRTPAAGGPGQEIRLPGLHRLLGGWEEAQNVEAASEDCLQHDARGLS
jgi:hypothetical protein